MEFIGLIVGSVSAIAGATAALFAGWQVRESRRTTQLQMFDATFKDIRAIEEQYYASVQGKGVLLEQQWCGRFFNTLEYLAFLLNTKLVSEKQIKRFYGDALIRWYDEIFLKKADEEARSNSQRFPELKQLRKRLK